MFAFTIDNKNFLLFSLDHTDLLFFSSAGWRIGCLLTLYVYVSLCETQHDQCDGKRFRRESRTPTWQQRKKEGVVDLSSSMVSFLALEASGDFSADFWRMSAAPSSRRVVSMWDFLFSDARANNLDSEASSLGFDCVS